MGNRICFVFTGPCNPLNYLCIPPYPWESFKMFLLYLLPWGSRKNVRWGVIAHYIYHTPRHILSTPPRQQIQCSISHCPARIIQSWVTLGEMLNVFKPQLSYQWNGNNRSSHYCTNGLLYKFNDWGTSAGANCTGNASHVPDHQWNWRLPAFPYPFRPTGSYRIKRNHGHKHFQLLWLRAR